MCATSASEIPAHDLVPYIATSTATNMEVIRRFGYTRRHFVQHDGRLGSLTDTMSELKGRVNSSAELNVRVCQQTPWRKTYSIQTRDQV